MTICLLIILVNIINLMTLVLFEFIQTLTE
jgi:hypothetical protein